MLPHLKLICLRMIKEWAGLSQSYAAISNEVWRERSGHVNDAFVRMRTLADIRSSVEEAGEERLNYLVHFPSRSYTQGEHEKVTKTRKRGAVEQCLLMIDIEINDCNQYE
ncbi:hypothetical protein RMATCC62417_16496 [Rhizopus microsporus]|nr:hypothetical protein RMATCC62417_16496 [Rhizopus microsporus]